MIYKDVKPLVCKGRDPGSDCLSLKYKETDQFVI